MMLITAQRLLCAIGIATFAINAIAQTQTQTQTQTQRKDQSGIAVEFSYLPDATTDKLELNVGASGLTRLKFTDANTGVAMNGFRPAAWLLAQRSSQVSQEISCDVKAQQLISGSLGARADVDLNSYRLVTLNDDNTIAFINPHVNLKKTKLESIIQLPGRGYDWAYLPKQHRLVVTLRDENAVVIIDTVHRRLVGRVEFAQGSLPTRLAADTQGKRVWVGLDGQANIAVIDIDKMTEVARLPVGRGLHTLVVVPKTPWVFVTNTEDSTVTVIDRVKLETVGAVTVSKTPVAAAWSEAANKLAVVGINGGVVDLLDPAAMTVASSIKLTPGVLNIGMFDQGRYAFVVNQLANSVALIDIATGTVKGELEVAEKPDQLSFSREFAYVRGQGTAKMSVLNLQQAREGRLQAIAVPMGQRAPDELPKAINVASVVASVPEGNGVMVANPGDGTIYRYAEGLMVPVGNFSNYRRAARALMILDSSLAENEAGSFEAPTRFELGGVYDVVVKNVRPAITQCFTVTVTGPNVKQASLALAPQMGIELTSVSVLGDGRASINLLLSDASSQPLADVDDATLLAVQVTSHWQRRALVKNLGGGRYEATVAVPPSGVLDLLLSVPSLDVGFASGRVGRVQLTQGQWKPVVIGARDDIAR
jgi:DNA-binding beta-propeller fold protein YncE